MELPLALKVLIMTLQAFFVGRLLGQPGVQLLQVLSPAVDGSLTLQLRLLQPGYFAEESLLLFIPHGDLCPVRQTEIKYISSRPTGPGQLRQPFITNRLSAITPIPQMNRLY
jgi:hypothetical protein